MPVQFGIGIEVNPVSIDIFSGPGRDCRQCLAENSSKFGPVLSASHPKIERVFGLPCRAEV